MYIPYIYILITCQKKTIGQVGQSEFCRIDQSKVINDTSKVDSYIIKHQLVDFGEKRLYNFFIYF